MSDLRKRVEALAEYWERLANKCSKCVSQEFQFKGHAYANAARALRALLEADHDHDTD